MTAYKKLAISPSEMLTKISGLFQDLKTGIDTISNATKASVEFAKLQASSANLALLALNESLSQIITEIEKMKGGVLSGIIAHPNSYGIKAGYDRGTDTMTLTAISALEQIKEAFDDKADPLAPDKFNDYGGLVIVGSAPGVEEFFKILEVVGKFFSQQELIDLSEQIKERWEKKEDDEVKLSKGLAFVGTSMDGVFPAYTKLLNKVQYFVEGIKSEVISSIGSLDDMVEFIEKKLEDAEEIAQDLKDFLDKFIFDLSEAGVYYKTFQDQKADDIKDELTEGTLESWKTAKYSFVFGIFGGSGAIELVLNFVP